jgi:hypothetical protein
MKEIEVNGNANPIKEAEGYQQYKCLHCSEYIIFQEGFKRKFYPYKDVCDWLPLLCAIFNLLLIFGILVWMAFFFEALWILPFAAIWLLFVLFLARMLIISRYSIFHRLKPGQPLINSTQLIDS